MHRVPVVVVGGGVSSPPASSSLRGRRHLRRRLPLVGIALQRPAQLAMVVVILAASWQMRPLWPIAQVSVASGPRSTNSSVGWSSSGVPWVPIADRWLPCAISGGVCQCTGTLILSSLMGIAVWEVNVDGEIQCGAEAIGAPVSWYPQLCWCQRGIAWGDRVRSGLTGMIRQGLVSRVEIAADEVASEAGCSSVGDGHWYGCLAVNRRWDMTMLPQVMTRSVSAEEQLDMSLRKLDVCHRLAPTAALRILGVRSGQSGEAMSIRVSASQSCSVVYMPGEGAMWTRPVSVVYCATQPGTCTTTLCQCQRSSDSRIELRTPQGQKCWACAEPGKEHTFRVNALAERMHGGSVTWWPPYGINCPPMLWVFMDWRLVVVECPALSIGFGLFLLCFIFRKIEEFTSGWLPWTRVAPLFGPALRRGEIWRLLTFTFFHAQFSELFHNLMTLVDTLDIEGTPAIILGDGSNLKCGAGARANLMCYPSIGIGTCHTVAVAFISAAIGGMCGTWMSFRAAIFGASALGFGLSGAVVALYALYAGAELDQATSIQRSFQDWVVLRLIFVAVHLVMECVRSISQRDASGLFAHMAAFIAGFSYVLYMLPPMGDGTMFSTGQPYIVPCAYSKRAFADHAAPDCIRIFSHSREYEVSIVKHTILIVFLAVVAFTVLNTAVLRQRLGNDEVVLLAGYEVSAVCGNRSMAMRRQPLIEGRHLFLWCEVFGANRLVDDLLQERQLAVEVNVLNTDPQKDGNVSLPHSQEKEASACTQPFEGDKPTMWQENLFVPFLYSKSMLFQLVLYDAHSSGHVAVGKAAVKMPQALRVQNLEGVEVSLRLQPIGELGKRFLASGLSQYYAPSVLRVRFRLLEIEDLRRLRDRVKAELDDGRPKLEFYEQRLAALMVAKEEGERNLTTRRLNV